MISTDEVIDYFLTFESVGFDLTYRHAFKVLELQKSSRNIYVYVRCVIEIDAAEYLYW